MCNTELFFTSVYFDTWILDFMLLMLTEQSSAKKQKVEDWE